MHCSFELKRNFLIQFLSDKRAIYKKRHLTFHLQLGLSKVAKIFSKDCNGPFEFKDLAFISIISPTGPVASGLLQNFELVECIKNSHFSTVAIVFVIRYCIVCS